MKILVIGAGKMGAWFTESLCLEHEVAVYDKDISKLRYLFHTLRLESNTEVQDFAPELVINSVSLQYTIPAFDEVLPYLPNDCILSDIMSVKKDIQGYYEESGFRYVSTHPMFGPTFANIKELANQNAIIISEGDTTGIDFFKKFYNQFELNLFEYTFDQHDRTIAYSLSVPFVSTMVFAAVMEKQDAPGTTFKKHLKIAKGLLSEDEHLLTEILLNPHTESQVAAISKKLEVLIEMLQNKDKESMVGFIKELRFNIL